MELFKRLPLPPSLPHICPGQPWGDQVPLPPGSSGIGLGTDRCILSKDQEHPEVLREGPPPLCTPLCFLASSQRSHRIEHPL